VADAVDLASLLFPTSVADFLNTAWAKSPFLAKSNGREQSAGLLNLSDFEFLLGTVAAPGWLSFVSGTVRPPSREQLTRDGTLDAAAMYAAFAARQSLLLTKVHRLHAATGHLCRRLTADFRSAGVVLRKPIRANAYYTPPQSQGFAPHYDDHDVLVLQLHGQKLWRIHGEAVKWPRRPMQDALPDESLNPRPREVTLAPGDVLYLPRGFVHEAQAQETSSLHLTFSIDAATWGDVFQRLVDRQDGLGEPLPVGFCAGGKPRAADAASLAQMGANIARWPGFQQAMTDIFNVTYAEGDLPANGYLARAERGRTLTADAWLVVADGVFASLELDANSAILRLPGAALRAEKAAAPLFRSLCDGNPFRIRDLQGAADASAFMELAQELLDRGVLIMR
jgi:hypothetical protein